MLLNIALDNENSLHNVLLTYESRLNKSQKMITDTALSLFGYSHSLSNIERLQKAYTDLQIKLFTPLQDQGFIAIDDHLRDLLQRQHAVGAVL